jgi:hypothetical protein
VIDACLPPLVAATLAAIAHLNDCTVDFISALYGHGGKDADWIAHLSAEDGALFITLDWHMRKRPIEVQAHLASRCVGIVLTSDWQDDDDHMLLARLLFRWRHILDCAKQKPPAMFEFTRSMQPRAPKEWRNWPKIRGASIVTGATVWSSGRSYPDPPEGHPPVQRGRVCPVNGREGVEGEADLFAPPLVTGLAPLMAVVVNRAPVLTLWAAVVAERLGHPATLL